MQIHTLDLDFFRSETIAAYLIESGGHLALVETGPDSTWPHLVAALFMAIPSLLRATPVSLINLPNKNYWLAPERREATLDRLASYFDVFASTTVLLLIVVFELASLASRGGSLDSNYFLPALVSYLVFSAGWTVALMRTFANVPSER